MDQRQLFLPAHSELKHPGMSFTRKASLIHWLILNKAVLKLLITYTYICSLQLAKSVYILKEQVAFLSSYSLAPESFC